MGGTPTTTSAILWNGISWSSEANMPVAHHYSAAGTDAAPSTAAWVTGGAGSITSTLEYTGAGPATKTITGS